MLEDFYKQNPKDKIWWAGDTERRGPAYFSFDKKKIFNFFGDYPDKLSAEEKEIFDKENPEMAALHCEE